MYIAENSHNITELNRQKSFLVRLSLTSARYTAKRTIMFTTSTARDFRAYFAQVNVPAKLTHTSRAAPET